MNIILGSASPRRQEILRNIGVEFSVLVPDIDETMDKTKNVFDEVMRISADKAIAVFSIAGNNDKNLVISADTMVLLDNTPMGKPSSEEEAFKMLKSLSGKTHKVVTAITLKSENKIDTKLSVSKVTFKPLSEERINAYIKTGEPMDKAGAYGIQGKGASLVEVLEGDFFAVMGIPAGMLCDMLEDFGVKVF